MYHNEDNVVEAFKESGLPIADAHRNHKTGSVRALRVLPTSYIDLLLIHESCKQLFAMYKAFKEVYQTSKVLAIGIYDFNADRYLAFIQTCGIMSAGNQVELHVRFS